MDISTHAKLMPCRVSIGTILCGLLAIYCLSIAGCAEKGPPLPTADVGPIGPTEGQIVNIKVNQTLLLSLRENPSTGFNWQPPEFDASILQLVSQPYHSDPSQEGMTGVGGTQYFLFKAIKAGETQMKLVNQRTTTPPDIVTQIHFTIKVE